MFLVDTSDDIIERSLARTIDCDGNWNNASDTRGCGGYCNELASSTSEKEQIKCLEKNDLYHRIATWKWSLRDSSLISVAFCQLLAIPALAMTTSRPTVTCSTVLAAAAASENEVDSSGTMRIFELRVDCEQRQRWHDRAPQRFWLIHTQYRDWHRMFELTWFDCSFGN